MAEIIAPQSSLKSLIAKGKEQTYLTYAEVNDHLPESISDPDQVEDIIQMINDMGIKVFETAPDTDALLLNEENDSGADEVAAAEAAAALAAVENEAGRTTDPVRMYMREMGTVELLTREGEIVIAKRIEEGLRELMKAMAYFPGTVEHILNEYALIDNEERRLNEIITGYLDTNDDEIPVSPRVEEHRGDVGSDIGDSDEDEDEANVGPDPKKHLFDSLKLENSMRRLVPRLAGAVDLTQKLKPSWKNLVNYSSASNSLPVSLTHFLDTYELYLPDCAGTKELY